MVNLTTPVQEHQLRILSGKDKIDYQTLRALFPLGISNFEKQLDELVHLKLVEKNIVDNETIYNITDEGKIANHIGLHKWVKKMVLKRAADYLYPKLTKTTTTLEEKAVRSLENNNDIYFNGKGYKKVPKKEYTLNPEPTSWYEKFNGFYDKHHRIIHISLGVLAILVTILVAFL
ncbi:hypothetical protein NE848_12810 [Gramella jeungdoensis]|uniref:Transcriptional regulator n=1 Tax=Gramella jeungdoensis TaxID=708091 RepID=A0ABT0Z536_9FLAO|nr:hypothetical protein [Gramella jeungdoensis]MCM8570267.1 hypothetical protein [Gramella jeungdoensis]